MASVDSMAYDYGARVAARERENSGTMEHRFTEISHWIRAAGRRMQPAAGGQMLLELFA